MVRIYLHRQLLLLIAALIFLVSQVQIHSTRVLAMYHFFPCNDFHLSFHWHQKIPYCVVQFLFQIKADRHKNLLVSAHRLQQGPYFNIFYVLESSCLSIHCSAFSVPSLNRVCHSDHSPHGPVVAASALPPLLSSLARTFSPLVKVLFALFDSACLYQELIELLIFQSRKHSFVAVRLIIDSLLRSDSDHCCFIFYSFQLFITFPKQ